MATMACKDIQNLQEPNILCLGLFLKQHPFHDPWTDFFIGMLTTWTK